LLFSDTYKTINNSCTAQFKDRGSKFIAYAYPVNSESEIKEILSNLKKEHHTAVHHCYAFRLGADKQAYRVNDDGEPSGTAGKPIFGQIQSHDLTNILIVVVRYFGGTLLGVSGLINAYKTATVEAIKNAEIIEKQVQDVYEIVFDYLEMNNVMKIIKDNNLQILKQEMQEKCLIQLMVRKNDSIKIYEIFKKISSLDIKYLFTT
jgi:uncharacterized YigZ family protein